MTFSWSTLVEKFCSILIRQEKVKKIGGAVTVTGPNRKSHAYFKQMMKSKKNYIRRCRAVELAENHRCILDE